MPTAVSLSAQGSRVTRYVTTREGKPMQITKYPLPPLFLSEVLDKAKDDHTHKCDEYCLEDDGTNYCGARFCRESKADNEALLDVPKIVRITEGHGRHVHDAECDERAARYNRRCFSDGTDSDWIVEVCYSANGWHAIYGVKRHGDVQDVQLWAD